ncbi:hypothetical protein BUALT_Bualt13G0048600 [Buddleja alternifolia]|uniref:Bifunctional inhibitor/plant lipid transfer protein/seed storage helical domain-containing protein n=1 Tax=Buddleja alternifolia TaxID=168488 RepID=A0AAV6WK07_9LAMI|nr:hypothetical protein BUALT_Bualt13G0048600 [Buddleja alternifolia]
MARAGTTTTAATTIACRLVFLVIFLVALPHIGAQSLGPTPAPTPRPMLMAPSPSLDCFNYLLNLSDCLTFVDSESNLTKPDPGCCPELADLVQNQPICLCQLLGNSSNVGFSVDTKRALKLPSLCRVSTPSVSLCAAIGFPIGVPVPSPSRGGSSPENPSKNGSPNNLGPNQHFLIGFVLVLFAYFFF